MRLRYLEQLSFWRGKKVFVTGHSGFKGSWLTMWLNHLGADLTGVSLQPATDPNLFSLCALEKRSNSHFIDIRNSDSLAKIMKQYNPEIIFHLAAQPIVRKSYLDPLTTFNTNVMGTVNILNGMRELSNLRSSVIITTDKVYENLENHRPYIESDKLGGYDPYSASKAASEIVVSSYCRSFMRERGVAISCARAGNIIGGGDWSEDRLLPDAVRAWSSNKILKIRSPNSVRPWQHVLEPLFGYMLLAQKQWESPELAGAFNFGPEPDMAFTVRNVAELAQSYYGSGQLDFGNEKDTTMHEAEFLLLNIEKSKTLLNFKPLWSVKKSIKKSIEWYQAYYKNVDAYGLCMENIIDYETSIGEIL